jgi:hypothetical protein
MYNEGEADEVRQLELDFAEEARCTALVQSARYLQGIRRYHDRNVRERSFTCVVFRTSLAYTSSIQGGKARSSSSRSQGQGLINYNSPRVARSRTPGTFRTCASSTLKSRPGDR